MFHYSSCIERIEIERIRRPKIKFRIEKDSLGEVNVPFDAYWGAQTQRALENFTIGSQKMPMEIIYAIAEIKKAAAKANNECGVLDKKKSDAIVLACDEILTGRFDEHFPLVIWQSGSGTQTNMNANEVISNRAIEILGGKKGSSGIIHPNDDVNKSQSSNDVFPSAMNIAAYRMLASRTIPALKVLAAALDNKASEFRMIIKTGRTHLMDAMPVSLGQEFSGYAEQVRKGISSIHESLNGLSELALGGTAVGTGINTPPGYVEKVTEKIAEITGIPLMTAVSKFEAMAAHDAIVQSSGALKRIAVSLMKITGDIRLMASGPLCGIGEIILPENEPGSSIMPGKVNPSQAEALAMVCARIIGNDTTISISGMSGNFELNVHKPLIVFSFLESAGLLADASISFSEKCISGIVPDLDNIRDHLGKSLMLAAVLNTHIGYDRAAEIARKARIERITLREAALKLGYLSGEEFDRYVKPGEMV